MMYADVSQVGDRVRITFWHEDPARRGRTSIIQTHGAVVENAAAGQAMMDQARAALSTLGIEELSTATV